jgi:predicted PurR-regulated permease PerM
LIPTSSTRASKRALFTLVVFSVLLLGMVISPLAKAFFLAAVLAGALYPAVTSLSKKLKGRRELAAGLMIALVLVVLLLPISWLAAFVVGEGGKAAMFISQTVRSEGMTGLVEHLPATARAAAQWVINKVPGAEQDLGQALTEQLSGQTGNAAAAVGGVLSATGALAFQAVMMLIALYALLSEGGRLVAWLEQISPLARGQFSELLAEFRRTSVVVMLSSAATAAVQALVATVGYLIAGVPHPIFFAALTFFVAFVPVVGAGGVCLAAAALVLATGHTVAAIFLALWGLLVVGLIDNVIKPMFAKRGMDMNTVVIFFSLIGGIAMFGALGFLLGPLTVALFLAVVRLWQRTYGGGPLVVEDR